MNNFLCEKMENEAPKDEVGIFNINDALLEEFRASRKINMHSLFSLVARLLYLLPKSVCLFAFVS